VKTEEANADFSNGVLEITIPAATKRTQAKSRQIEIGGEVGRPQARARAAGQK